MANLTIPAITIPAFTVPSVTIPSVTIPTASFTVPAAPTMPSTTALTSVVSGFPPAAPDLAGIQGNVTAAVASGNTALQACVTQATGAITGAAATLKTKETEFNASLVTVKTSLLTQLEGRAPSQKEMADLKTVFESSRTSFAAAQESMEASVKSLQTTLESTAGEVESISTASLSSLDGLQGNLTSFGSMLD